MNIRIRHAGANDVEEVYRFVCDLEETIFDPQAFHQYFLYNIEDPKNIYLVAVDEEEVIGFLSCHGQLLLHHMNWVYEIQEFFVDKPYRGKGTGKLLLQAIEQVLSGKNYDTLEVSSSHKRKDAHQFYAESGFAQSHLKFTKKRGE